MIDTNNQPQAVYTKVGSSAPAPTSTAPVLTPPLANVGGPVPNMPTVPAAAPAGGSKKPTKKKINSKAIFAVLGLLIFFVVALGAVMVSQKQRISKAPVAPTAPESRPAAAVEKTDDCSLSFDVGTLTCDSVCDPDKQIDSCTSANPLWSCKEVAFHAGGVQADPFGNMPWSNGGPTAGWTDQERDIITVCNGRYCWQYNINTNTWNNEGYTYDLETWQDNPDLAVQAASDGTLPWANGGPTAGWTDDTTGNIAICSGKWCWTYSVTSRTWTNNALPIDISTHDSWAPVQAAPDGTLPWSNGGPTAGWTDQNRHIITMCSGKYCWQYNLTAGAWNNNGFHYDLETWQDNPATTVQAASDGTLPWSNGGPTAGWNSSTTGIINTCNGQWCWKYSVADGAWLNDSRPVDISTSATWTGTDETIHRCRLTSYPTTNDCSEPGVTITPIITQPPTTASCGESCETIECEVEFTCVEATEGSYCSMPAYVNSCAAAAPIRTDAENYALCCTEPTPTVTPVPGECGSSCETMTCSSEYTCVEAVDGSYCSETAYTTACSTSTSSNALALCCSEPTPTVTPPPGSTPTPTLPPGVTPTLTPPPGATNTPTPIIVTSTPGVYVTLPPVVGPTAVVVVTPPPGCNDTCTANADCTPASSRYICYNGRCRLDTNPENEYCQEGQQPVVPTTLPQTGPSDWINALKAGLGVLGIGALLLLLL